MTAAPVPADSPPSQDEAGEVLWAPPPDVRERTRIGHYLSWLEAERGLHFDSYQELWSWSVTDLEGFWSSVWDFFEVAAHSPYRRVLEHPAMPGAVWFPGATLNYAEHTLRAPDDDVVILSRSQTRGPVDLTASELRDQVGRARAGLVRLGVQRGDRVVAYLPNIHEAIVAFLAAASLGAIWSSCAPDFGTRSVVDRFRQIEPKVLVTIDGYRYGSTAVDRRAEVADIRSGLPTLEATVVVPYLDPDPARIPQALSWNDLLAKPAQLSFDPVRFSHPLYVLYSSGTTGLPKPIVHGHGGILLEHLKALGLHLDLEPQDRFFWFSTTGWMMWNFLVSGLLLDGGIVLFDGNPGYPDLLALWRLAEETGMALFGTAAPYVMACRKQGLHPGRDLNLSRLRGVASTASPLPPQGFRWVYEAVGRDLLLASVSGGTDVCTAFVGGTYLLPVRAGEIACRLLGAKVEAYDDDGRSVIGQQGELVVTAPMPSMPVCFWNDPDGARYRAAYFDKYPGVWRHGDWITITEQGSCVISGRSDATLNRGGVRLGTSEFYSVVEAMDEVVDSLVVHLEDPKGGMGELVLFVVLGEGAELDDALRGRIAGGLRSALSPRHVPDSIYAVSAVPKTLSGKKLEVPVKRILTGTPSQLAASRDSLTDPDALVPFEKLAQSRAEHEMS